LKFEQRQGDLEKCRIILEKFIDVNPVPSSFVKAANFEEHQRNHARARAYYERALVELGKRAFAESFFIAFTKFEIRQHELERAKILFDYALANLPADLCKTLAD
jgi:crooked neck